MAHAELAADKKYHNILYKHKQSNKLQMTVKKSVNATNRIWLN